MKNYDDMEILSKTIKYHEEMAKERYLNDGSHERLANWLKELKEFRESEDSSKNRDYSLMGLMRM